MASKMGFHTVFVLQLLCAAMSLTTTRTDSESESDEIAPTVWPMGNYSLVMARESCPDGNFLRGTRVQDTEDTENFNIYPENSAMLGPINDDVFTWHFCTHVDDGTGSYQWPKGNYCIHRAGRVCLYRNLRVPGVFKEGAIIFDDEDVSNPYLEVNKNEVKGYLPGGKFDQDTRFNYCCREDGDADTPIGLPNTKPFYLYKFKSSCQKVKGMRVTEERYGLDTENYQNHDELYYSTPLGDRSLGDSFVRFTMCLYTPDV